MNRAIWLALSLAAASGCGAQPGPSTRDPDLAAPPAGSVLLGVYVGKIPCTSCERVKMELVLHQRAADGAPSAYVLDQVFVGLGDDRTTTRGRWSRQVGTPGDPHAVIYRLHDPRPAGFADYRAVGGNILLLLGDDLEPLVGNEAHSYTLSRAPLPR